MHTSKEELKTVTENEGIIIGSALITAEEAKADESKLAFLKGGKAGGRKYSLEMQQRGFKPFSTKYSIVVTPGKEEAFIKSMPAGDYVINSIRTKGFIQLRANTKVHLTVAPGKSTYIGRLVVNFPHRIRAGSGFNIVVYDDQEECIESLKKEYPSHVSDVVKGLMVVK